MTAYIRYRSTPTITVAPSITHLPPYQSGDHVYVFLVAYGKVADTTGACDGWTVPDGWTLSVDLAITESATVVGRFGVLTRLADVGTGVVELTNPCNAAASQLYIQSFSIANVGGTPGLDIVTVGPLSTDDLPLPEVPVHQDDTLVLQYLVSVGYGTFIGTPSSPYTIAGSNTLPTLHGGRYTLYQGGPVGSDVAAQPHIMDGPVRVSDGGAGWLTIFGIALTPAFVGGPPAGAPSLARLRLGCADDYRVFVTAGDYETIIDGVGWSDLEWSRVLDEPSTAQVTVPDRYGGLRCCAHLGGLVPWRYGLRIERNDAEVWSGPVTNVQRQAEAFRVSASDVMARFQKRLATRDLDFRFAMADAGRAFLELIEQAHLDSDPWQIHAPDVTVGAAIARDILVRDFEMAWDILNDIAEASVDFWIGNGVLYMHEPGTGWMYYSSDGYTVRLDGPYTGGGNLIYGTFTEDAFIGLPQWSVNGWAQTNTAWVPGADIGESGARLYWTANNPISVMYDGVLDGVETFNLYRPEDEADIPQEVYQQFADGLVAIRGMGPPIMEGTTLAESAPVSVDHLRPGSLWQIDVWDACYGQLLQLVRLKRVTVRASKSGGEVTETVEPVLFPVG